MGVVVVDLVVGLALEPGVLTTKVGETLGGVDSRCDISA